MREVRSGKEKRAYAIHLLFQLITKKRYRNRLWRRRHSWRSRESSPETHRWFDGTLLAEICPALLVASHSEQTQGSFSDTRGADPPLFDLLPVSLIKEEVMLCSP